MRDAKESSAAFDREPLKLNNDSGKNASVDPAGRRGTRKPVFDRQTRPCRPYFGIPRNPKSGMRPACHRAAAGVAGMGVRLVLHDPRSAIRFEKTEEPGDIRGLYDRMLSDEEGPNPRDLALCRGFFVPPSGLQKAGRGNPALFSRFRRRGGNYSKLCRRRVQESAVRTPVFRRRPCSKPLP